MRRVIMLVAVSVVALAVQCFGDTVRMKNGDRLTGTIIKADEKSLVIKTDYAGSVTVEWKAVDAIESVQDLNVFSRAGQKLLGKVTTSGNNLEIVTKDAGRVTLSRDDVTMVRNVDEQLAWQKEQDRYADPGLLDLWSGSADLGVALTSGNSATTSINAGLDLARVTRRDKMTVFYRQVQASDRNQTPSVRIANAKRAGVQYDLKLSRRTFVFGFTNFDFDELMRLDLRFVAGGGFGYSVIKTDRSTFDLSGGLAFNKEIFDITPAPTIPIPNPSYATLTRDSMEAFAGEEWRFRLNPRTSFFEKAVFFPNLSNTGEFRLNFDAGLSTSLSKYLSWNIAFSNRYLSNPPLAGLKKNDSLLSTGIRFTFAK